MKEKERLEKGKKNKKKIDKRKKRRMRERKKEKEKIQRERELQSVTGLIDAIYLRVDETDDSLRVNVAFLSKLWMYTNRDHEGLLGSSRNY